MQKGVSQAVLLVLITMIGISLASLTYLFATGTLFEIFPSQFFNTTYLRSRACLSLEDVDFYNANITVKNCGLVPLSNFRLLIDLVEVPLPISMLDPQESATGYYARSFEGEHEFIVFADYAETPLVRLDATEGLDEQLNRTFRLLISKSRSTAPADNITSIIIFARLVDKNGNPIPGELITFSKSGVGYLSRNSDTTNSTGYATTSIKSDRVGYAIIAAIYNSSINLTSVYFYRVGEQGPICGNGICEPGEFEEGCPDCFQPGEDGPRCGNGICEKGEDPDSCPLDCELPGDGNQTECDGDYCKPGETCEYARCDNLPPQWVCCENGICPC